MPFEGMWSPMMLFRRVARRTLTTARAKPVLFHPPFSACIMGQRGLFVAHAYFTTLDARSPPVHARILASSRAGLARSPVNVTAHVKQLSAKEKPNVKSRYAGSLTRYARRPERDSRWISRGLAETRERTGGIQSNKGDMVTIIMAS